MGTLSQELCEKTVADTGLYIGKKLTREHIQLTSYSRGVPIIGSATISATDMVFFYQYWYRYRTAG